jgi:hypothetical protein
MKRPGRDIASIVLAILVGLVVILAFYFYFLEEFEPTARPPL